MRYLLLKLFNLTAILTFLFCIALAILWPISFETSLQLDHSSPEGSESVLACRGQIGVSLATYRNPVVGFFADTWNWSHAPHPTANLQAVARSLMPRAQVDSAGFFVGHTSTDTLIVLPIWFLILIPLHLPAAAYAAHRGKIRRQRKLKKNLCPTCNYDLRATPAQCPECGTTIIPAKM